MTTLDITLRPRVCCAPTAYDRDELLDLAAEALADDSVMYSLCGQSSIIADIFRLLVERVEPELRTEAELAETRRHHIASLEAGEKWLKASLAIGQELTDLHAEQRDQARRDEEQWKDLYLSESEEATRLKLYGAELSAENRRLRTMLIALMSDARPTIDVAVNGEQMELTV